MPVPRTLTALLARLLVGVMLAMALLPGLSRAWAAGQGDWVELCTAQGVRWVSLSTGETGEPDFKPLSEPCAACLLHAQGAAPPPSPMAWALPERFTEVPAAFLRAPSLPAVWRTASSRGPPSQD